MSSTPLVIEYDAQRRLQVTFFVAHGSMNRDLTSLLHDAKARYQTREVLNRVLPGTDWSSLVHYVVTIFGTAGGLAGAAAILKAFFGRNKGTTVKFGKDGQVVQADGLSVDEIIHLLEACDQRSREALAVQAEIPDKTDKEGEIGPH